MILRTEYFQDYSTDCKTIIALLEWAKEKNDTFTSKELEEKIKEIYPSNGQTYLILKYLIPEKSSE